MANIYFTTCMPKACSSLLPQTDRKLMGCKIQSISYSYTDINENMH